MTQIGEPYKNFTPDESFDAIVIGSGIGGLSVAALLAKHAGKKVLVLERHTTAGGFTHTFSRRGYEWDVGLHYIGGVLRPNALLRRLFDEITDGELQWEPMGEVYDTVVIGEDRYEYVTGRESWRERMHSYFPGEAAAIDQYLELVQAAVGSSRSFFSEKAVPAPLALVLGPWMRRGFLRHADRTLADVLDELTDNPTLKAVLSAQYGDYGLPPSQASFAIHAMVSHHYLDGAAYPIGGSARIAATVAPVIESAGGRIVVGAEVSEILVEGRRAVGVRMADGRELWAAVVISDAGVPNTAFDLLPKEAPGRDVLAAALSRTPRSAAHLGLYVGLQQTDEELGLGRSNLWIYPSADQDGDLARYLVDPEAPLPLVYISFPSAKDPDFARRHPGRATIEIISFAPYHRFAPWENQPWHRRGEDYEALKEQLSQRLIEVLEREVPQVAGKIDYYELSTPLSTRHFAGYPRGEIYGLDHSPARFRERALKPKTQLNGFFLTGQDVCTAGIAGALFGGVLAASSILGKNLLGKIGRGSRE